MYDLSDCWNEWYESMVPMSGGREFQIAGPHTVNALCRSSVFLSIGWQLLLSMMISVWIYASIWVRTRSHPSVMMGIGSGRCSEFLVILSCSCVSRQQGHRCSACCPAIVCQSTKGKYLNLIYILFLRLIVFMLEYVCRYSYSCGLQFIVHCVYWIFMLFFFVLGPQAAAIFICWRHLHDSRRPAWPVWASPWWVSQNAIIIKARSHLCVASSACA